MPKTNKDSLRDLRNRVEKLLKQSPEDIKKLPLEEIQKLVLELQKHQVELEMQNEALRLSEKRFRDLYDNAPYPYLSVRAEDGRIMQCNAAVRHLLGYDKKTLLGMKVFDLYSEAPSGLAKAKQTFGCFKAGKSINDVELQMKHKDGHSIWISLSVEPVRDPQGTVIESRSVVIGISQRKEAEEALKRARDELEERVNDRTSQLLESNKLLRAEFEERLGAEESLRESERKYSALVESSLTGIYLIQDNIIVFANERFAEIHGYSRNEVIGMEASMLVHPEDRKLIDDMREKRLQGEDVQSEYEARALKKNNESIWVQRRIALTEYKDKPAILGNIVDTTGRKLMEEALRKSEQELRLLSSQLIEAQEEESKRIAMELHDGIGQSLSAIKFTVENAMGSSGSQEGSGSGKLLRPVLSMIGKAVEEVRRISRNLRPAILDHLGILATISWHCREFGEIHPNIHTQQCIEVEEDEIPVSLKIVIYRILQEAFNNIAKHSRADKVRLELGEIDRNLSLIVEDNGVGFDIQKALSVDQIKEGLGLVSMKERTEMSGGTFFLESNQGKGTSIQAIWPIPS